MTYTIICVSQHGEEEIEGVNLTLDEALSQLKELLVEEEEGESYLVRETVDEDIEEAEESEDFEELKRDGEDEEEEEEEYQEAN